MHILYYCCCRYHVHHITQDVPHNFEWLVKAINTKADSMPRTLIFFNSIAKLSSVYSYVKAYVNSDYKLFIDMYHQSTPDGKKDSILKDLSSESGSTIKVVLCSSSFSLGVNLKNIAVVCHYGAPSTTEQFIQEVGRVAREPGSTGFSLLLTYSTMLSGRTVDSAMKEFYKTSGCRRSVLLKSLDVKLVNQLPCCDNCNTILHHPFQDFIFPGSEAGICNSRESSCYSSIDSLALSKSDSN